jgi:hypothetical protein
VKKRSRSKWEDHMKGHGMTATGPVVALVNMDMGLWVPCGRAVKNYQLLKTESDPWNLI